MIITGKLKSKLTKIKLIVFDFDGVMTDNRALLSETGEEFVFVSRADGIGIHMLENMGFKVIFLSSETKPLVARRADKLQIPVINGVNKKIVALADYMKENSVTYEEVLYVGNDINDFDCLSAVGVSVVTHDATSCVKKIATFQLKTRGGYGVSRELADIFSRIRR